MEMNEVSTQRQSFPLQAVRLGEGPFKQAMLRNGEYLLSLDPDRLLAGFRKNAMLPEKAKPYGGWEGRGLVGHSLGHYLSACALMYASSGDERYRARVSVVVEALAECQAAFADGFLAGMPNGRALFDDLAAGRISSKGAFDLNGAWVPLYNQHKLFAGLRDAYRYAGSERALQVLIKLSDFTLKVCSDLSDTQMQAILAVEHGGMLEALADVASITGDRKYLTLSRRFWHDAVLNPLAEGRDELTGRHANTQIPKVIGAARLYELTGDPAARRCAETFWNAVTMKRSFVTGSNSDHEHFFALGLEAAKLGPQNGETCNVHNMLTLTRHLAWWSERSTYFDFYERALFNHVLGSIDPQSGMTTYFQSLQTGRFKVYGTPFDSFWCCTGTGMENHARYAADIYSRAGDDTLYVDLFVASSLRWEERNLSLTQTTDFPLSDATTLRVQVAAPTSFKLKIRVPAWAEKGIEVSGAVEARAEAGAGYLALDRTWRDGDTVTVRLPMSLRSHASIDDPTMTAFIYGPIVLAARLGNAGMPADNVADHLKYDRLPLPPAPVIVTDAPVRDWLKPVEGKPLHFRAQGVAQPGDLEFVPFYTVHHERYGVYLRVVTPKEHEAKRQELAAQEQAARELAARTIDEVVFGEQQSEVDHDIRSKNSRTGRHLERPWRDATDGGFFSVRLKISGEIDNVLRCTYWGRDRDRVFDILIDGQHMATVTLGVVPRDEFVEVDYALPRQLREGRQAVTVEFRPHAGSIAGGVFGCRMLMAPAK